MEVLAEIPTAYSAKVLRIRKLFLWEGKPFFVNSIKGESVCKDGSGSGGEQYHNLLWIEISIPQLIVAFFGGIGRWASGAEGFVLCIIPILPIFSNLPLLTKR
jgi:hypothetical protein